MSRGRKKKKYYHKVSEEELAQIISDATEHAGNTDLVKELCEYTELLFERKVMPRIQQHMAGHDDFISFYHIKELMEKEDDRFFALDEDNIGEYLGKNFPGDFFGTAYVSKNVLKCATLSKYIRKRLISEGGERTKYIVHAPWLYDRAMNRARELLSELISEYFKSPQFGKVFLQRDKALRLKDNYNHRMRAKEYLQVEILETIPQELPDLFPRARMLQRHFVLHIGPTNSGKTYGAIRELVKAGSGVYLAPLRLLAYEQYETMSEAGIPVTLMTGEEKIVDENANHVSSTIEMADFGRYYECAVIDEAQMIADPDRGGAWTFSILGLMADRIHVCMSPDGEERIKEMILSCGDTYEVMYHERKTPLVMQNKAYSFPEDIEKGDALIVFTRVDVHRVAAQLQSENIRCSMIYGSLPYETRHGEAARFASGETDVVVATDAIGMGMNLPIRRVVFLQTLKYDGHSRRHLLPGEIKQIAGRAGRYGLYDEGYVASPYERRWIKKQMSLPPEDISDAVLGFPELLLKLDMPVSLIMEKWLRVPCPQGYTRSDLKQEIKLARLLEAVSDDKESIYRLAMIPFNESMDFLMSVWKELSYRVLKGEPLGLRGYIPLTKNEDEMSANDALSELEGDYHLCDMLYNFSEKFGEGGYSDEIIGRKKEIAESISRVLSEKKLRLHRCSECGRELAWNAQFGLCVSCYEKQLYKRHRR